MCIRQMSVIGVENLWLKENHTLAFGRITCLESLKETVTENVCLV